MNALKNKVQLIGNVGNTPEILTLASGRKFARFSMATNESYKNSKGEKVMDTQWHDIVAWGKTAELIESFVPKGKEIGVEGRLTNRSYKDKDGVKHSVTEILCSELLLLRK